MRFWSPHVPESGASDRNRRLLSAVCGTHYVPVPADRKAPIRMICTKALRGVRALERWFVERA